MIKWMLMLFLLTGCLKGEDGSDGSNGMNGLDGSDGSNYYTYEINGNIQEIVGDDVREAFETSEGNVYRLPEKFDVTVDNQYPDCDMRDLTINLETESNTYQFVFQPTVNRYKMKYKSGPLEKLVDSSYIKVYYESEPEVDCGNAIYRLHSGITFTITVMQKLDLED